MQKQLIKQVLAEQQQEIGQVAQKPNLITRDIADKVKQGLEDDLIKVIIGIRRCGKSTLAHQVLADKNYAYINFDDERLIGVGTQDLNYVLEVLQEIKSNFEYLLLDEIQNIQGWELFANRLKRNGYNLIITGSNAKLLSRELATHLTGRHIAFELYPFSFREFLRYKKVSFKQQDLLTTRKKAEVKSLLQEYIHLGGLPEVYTLNNQAQYLRDLYDKIISRDIAGRYKIKYIKALKELALYVFSNFSGLVTYQKLKRLFEFKSVHTVKNYLNYLSEAYLVFELAQFSFKLKQQVKTARKVYAIDTGLLRALAWQNSPDKGKLLENLVFLELKKRTQECYFYTDAQNKEVDFVVRQNRKIQELLQVTQASDINDIRDREINSLIRVAKELKNKNLTIITWDFEDEMQKKSFNIKFIPIWKWVLR